MMEAFFGFKKTPFGDSPDPKQLFPSQAWNQAKARLQFLAPLAARVHQFRLRIAEGFAVGGASVGVLGAINPGVVQLAQRLGIRRAR